MGPNEIALSAALSRTGFPFEHHVYGTVVRHGWNARSSRLYIDADEKKAREMDLLCYRMSKGRQVTTCTALLISCKQRVDKPWVLLTRRWPERSRGWVEYPPVPACTNSPALNWELQQQDWALDYFNLAEASGLEGWSADSKREVFALQEFEPAKTNNEAPRFNPRGDASMYEGAMTLLKALAFETASVSKRRAKSKEHYVYQFNLLQLIDGDLFEANFDATPPEVKSVPRYRYFARTMLEGKEFSARIEFCTRAALEPMLAELSKLHEFNCGHFNQRVDRFYELAFSSTERREALLPLLERRLAPVYHLYSNDDEDRTGWVRLDGPWLDKPLKVLLLANEVAIKRATAQEGFIRAVRKSLKEVFRYEGDFEVAFDDDIPF